MNNCKNDLDLLKTICDDLIINSQSIKDIGLLNGKLGISIYLFQISRILKIEKYERFAEKLIDQIIDQIDSNLSSTFDNGLAGIAYGLHFLIHNQYIETDGKDIFTEIDNQIFRSLTDKSEISIFENIGYIIYLTSGLDNKDSISIRYQKRLLIELINNLSQNIDSSAIFQEPLLFDITWNLPLLLYSLSKVLELKLYEHKITRIIEHISVPALSFFPCLNCNRLYLFWGMKCVLQYMHHPNWENHSELLKQNINMDIMFSNEFKNKSISVDHGISGVMLIIDHLYVYFSEESFRLPSSYWVNRILSSDYWVSDREYFGFLAGYTGIGLALLSTIK